MSETSGSGPVAGGEFTGNPEDLGCEALEARLAQLEAEAEQANAAAGSIFEEADQNTQDRIAQAMHDHDLACREASDEGRQPPPLASFLAQREGIPSAITVALGRQDSVVAEAAQVEAELDSPRWGRATRIHKLLTGVERSVDYDGVVQAIPADNNFALRSSLSFIVGARRILGAGTKIGYRGLKDIERQAEECIGQLHSQGLITNQPAGWDILQSPSVGLSDRLHEASKKIATAENLQLRYGSRLPGAFSGGDVRSELFAYQGTFDEQNNVRTVEELWIRRHLSVNVNQGLADAIERHAASRIGQLPAAAYELDPNSQSYREFAEAARAIDIDAALDGLEVTGNLSDLPFDYSEADLKRLIRDKIPALALSGTKRIEFRPLTEGEKDEQYDTLGIHTQTEDDVPIIVISDELVRKNYEDFLDYLRGTDETDPEGMAGRIAKSDMEGTIGHELAHGLHKVLPVAALQRWEDACATDGTNVTAYIQHCMETGDFNRFKEGFADPVTLFANRPEDLAVASEARFRALDQLYSEIHHSYPAFSAEMRTRLVLMRILRHNDGISDEDYRSRLLSHETAAAVGSLATLSEGLTAVVEAIEFSGGRYRADRSGKGPNSKPYRTG